MKFAEAMILWNPKWTDEAAPPEVRRGVKVVPHPPAQATHEFRMSSTPGMRAAAKTKDMQLAMLFIEFNTLVVRDGIDPAAAHSAFLEIDEYRQHIARDQSGAED